METSESTNHHFYQAPRRTIKRGRQNETVTRFFPLTTCIMMGGTMTGSKATAKKPVFKSSSFLHLYLCLRRAPQPSGNRISRLGNSHLESRSSENITAVYIHHAESSVGLPGLRQRTVSTLDCTCCIH